MYRNLFFILVGFLFLSACAHKNSLGYENYEQIQSNALDLKLLKAFNYEYFGEFKQARDIFLELFQDYNNTNFLENAFLLTLANNLDKASELDALVQDHLDQSDNLKRLSLLYALENLNITKAEKLAKSLLAKKDNDARNFELYADVLMKKRQFKSALSYYRAAYMQVQNEELVLKMFNAYAILNDEKNAKILLENFRASNACTLRTCLLLMQIYRSQNNNKGLESIYAELYEITLDKNFILELLKLLGEQNKKQEALNIALKYNLEDIAIFLYQELKLFEEAKNLSLKIFEENKNKEYLLRAAIFEFEQASLNKNINKQILDSIVAKFEKGINKNSDALYLNYYGYLLIDYDLDVKKGMKLVELALKEESENFYFIDSLAWGYYKLGDCNKAWELLEQTFSDEEFKNSEESKAHIKAIKACLNDFR